MSPISKVRMRLRMPGTKLFDLQWGLLAGLLMADFVVFSLFAVSTIWVWFRFPEYLPRWGEILLGLSIIIALAGLNLLFLGWSDSSLLIASSRQRKLVALLHFSMYALGLIYLWNPEVKFLNLSRMTLLVLTLVGIGGLLGQNPSDSLQRLVWWSRKWHYTFKNEDVIVLCRRQREWFNSGILIESPYTGKWNLWSLDPKGNCISGVLLLTPPSVKEYRLATTSERRSLLQAMKDRPFGAPKDADVRPEPWELFYENVIRRLIESVS